MGDPLGDSLGDPLGVEPTVDASTVDDLPRLLTIGRRILHREGGDSHVGGQVSARSADGRGFWATGFTRFDQGTPDDVALVGWDLTVLAGDFPLAGALGFHTDVYRLRPDVGAVVHLHSPAVTVLSTTGQVVGTYDVTAVCFADEQVVHADDGVTPHRAVAEALGDGRVVLMHGHGALVASDSIEHAIVEAITLERCAGIHLRAVAAGGTEIVPAEVEAGRRNFRPLYLRTRWEAELARTLADHPELRPA